MFPRTAQNFFMYSNSMVINLVLLGFRGQLAEAFTADAFATILNWKVIALILNNAAIGIVTSLFLKVSPLSAISWRRRSSLLKSAVFPATDGHAGTR